MADETRADIVPLDELARRLRISKAWLRRETMAGRIPSLKAGRARLFNPAAVEESLAARAAAMPAQARSEGS